MRRHRKPHQQRALLYTAIICAAASVNVAHYKSTDYYYYLPLQLLQHKITQSILQYNSWAMYRKYFLGILYRKNRQTCENWGTLTPRSSRTVHRMKKWPTSETPWPLDYNVEWTVSLQCVLWAVGWSEYGTCLAPFSFKVFRGKLPLNGKFLKSSL